MLERVIATITLISLCLLGTLFAFTTPGSVGPFGLLVIFVAAYLACLGLISFFLFFGSRILGYALALFNRRTPRYQALSFRRAYYFSTILAGVPVMLLGLQSVGGVGIYESLLVLIFAIVGCAYIAKRLV